MRFHGRRTIVQRIRVLRRFTLQLTLIAQCSGAAVAKESVVSDEFNIVAGVTSFYTVNAYRVPIRRVARLATVKVVHGEGSVRGDFV